MDDHSEWQEMNTSRQTIERNFSGRRKIEASDVLGVSDATKSLMKMEGLTQLEER